MKGLFISAVFICTAFLAKAQTNFTITENGKHIVYYQNGNVKAQGNYQNNKKEGEWNYFYDNGKLALKKNFVNGEQVGEWTYYNQDGSLAFKVDDIAKIEEKADITRYENNKVKTKVTFVNGKKEITPVKNEQGELNNKF